MRQQARSWLLRGPFRSPGGFAWIADLPPDLANETDNDGMPYRSRLRLMEADRELGPGHAIHADIQEVGDGRYSFWKDVVYFSTPDGSDPNFNGRLYSVARVNPKADPRTVLRAITAAAYADWSQPERPLRCAVFGLGNRGIGLVKLLTGLAGVEIRWVCDSLDDRVHVVCSQLKGEAIKGCTKIDSALADAAVDAVFITVPDYLHREVARRAFEAGKHVYLEKPLATTVADGKEILNAWARSGRILQLGYVLRRAGFYQAISNAIRQHRLGPVRVVSLSDQLDVLHGASYMRRWHAQSALSGGLIVHKSCHDLDLICWLLDTHPVAISSFGGCETFTRTPPATFCSQCPERNECVYVDTARYERRSPTERANPTAYGLDRCVFRDDKDIVDNQVVLFEMANGVRGTFYLAMQGPRRSERRITIIGDDARLDGVLEDGRFTINYNDAALDPVRWSAGQKDSHGGGDRTTVTTFLNACIGRMPPPIKTPSEAIASLVFACAAETARHTCSVVTLSAADFEGGLSRATG